MPLVPQHTYEAWFAKTSWVYRSFIYLWSNPLWDRTPPKGFSLCPYWWLALFSLFVFRPLVYLILGFGAIVRLLRLRKVVETTDRWLRGVGFDMDGGLGASTFCALCLLIIASLAGAGIVLGCVEAWAGGQFLTAVLLWPNLLLFLFCWAYASYADKEGDTNRCRVEVYVRVALGVTLALLAVFHTAALVEAFVIWPLAALGWVLGGIWWCIKWVVLAVISAFTGSTYALIGLGLGVGLTVIGWISLWLLPCTTPDVPRVTRAQVKANLVAIATFVYRRLSSSLGLGYSDTADIVKRVPEAVVLAQSKPELLDGDMVPMVDIVTAFILEERRVKAAHEAARSASCKRFTALLAKVFSPVTAVWRQARIGWSYVKALVKARKSGWCPYLGFHD